MKKFLFVLVSVFMLIGFTGCNFGQVEDTNGEDDYSLVKYTDGDITNKSSSYSALGLLENNIGSNKSISASKFSGIYTIDTIDVSSGTLVFSIESELTAGNFRIVIVKDGSIVDDAELNKTDTIEIVNANGKYVLKVVGESAKFSVKWTVQK